MLKSSILGLFLAIQSFAFSQWEGTATLYSSEELKVDNEKIAKQFGGITAEFMSEKELDDFLVQEVFSGNALKDTMRKLTLKEIYFYNSRNDFGVHRCRLGLLTQFSKYFSDEKLESSYRKMAESFMNFKNYMVAREFFEKSLAYKNESVYAYTCTQIGSCYMHLEELDAALKWYEKALDLQKDPPKRVGYLNSVGYIEFLRGDYDQARSYYEKAMDGFEEHSTLLDSFEYYNIQSNLASVEWKKGDFQEAITRLERILSDYHQLESLVWFQREVYSKCLDVSLDMGNCQKVSSYLNKLSKSLPSERHDRFQLKYITYQIRANEQCGLGNSTGLFNKYTEEQKYIEAYERKLLNEVERMEQGLFTDQIELVSSNLSLKEESEEILSVSNTRLRRLIWISVILMVLIIGFFVFQFIQAKRIQKRKESFLDLKKNLLIEQQKSNALKIQMAEKEMENKRLELSRLLNSIDRNSSLTAEIVARIETIAKKDETSQEDIKSLLHFVRSRNQEERIEEMLNENIDLLGERIKERVMKKYPNLTASELQLVILIKLGLSTKEMAALKNVEPASIRIFKHRLKSKLNLSQQDDLHVILQEL